MAETFVNKWPEENLTINPNSIVMDTEETVMHSWEKPLMEAKADFVCKDGGHILELGFGMGISATAIQSHNIKSHTICEIHPQIIKNLKEWAKDKPNVIILEGDWYDNIDKMKKYDGILFDTHRDPSTILFKNFIPKIANKGCKITWWNNADKEYNELGLNNVNFKKIKVSPPKNNYFNYPLYWMPKYIY